MQTNAARVGFSMGSRLAPALTAAVAERLFLTTQRRAPRDGERDVLQGASPFRIAGMRAWAWGKGPTVLLVHGWNGRATQLGEFVGPLVDRGYSVVAFDAFGHGDSPGRRLSLPEMASCIRQVANELGAVYGVIAHSMGGAATILALAQGLQIDRAVFVAPPADLRLFLKVFSDTLGISDEVRDRVQRRIELRLGMPMEQMRADLLARSMQIPLLVIHDQDDKEVPLSAGQSIANAWPGAELIVTKGFGHQRILRAEAIRNVAVRFIDAVKHWKIAA